MRSFLPLLIALLLVALSGEEAAAQCDNCFDGECYTGGTNGVTGCYELAGGGCWVETATCCYDEGCSGPKPPIIVLLDGSVQPPSLPEQDVLANQFSRAGAVFVRLCQGDVIHRRYGDERVADIRQRTSSLVL